MVDTKVDLIKVKSFSASQESLSATLGLVQPKVHMNQAMWRAANRLHNLKAAKERVVGDVIQHMAMRVRLLEQVSLGHQESGI